MKTIILFIVLFLWKDSLPQKEASSLTARNYNDLVINEIMYAPSAGEPEWIELFNNSSLPVNINNWKFADNKTSVVIKSEKVIEPGSFLVLSGDSTIFLFYNITGNVIVSDLPALNNSGDAAVISDPSGIMTDSVGYLPEWGGGSGKSLERISAAGNSQMQSNWGTSGSIFKATPGFINSISAKNFDMAAEEIFCSPQYPVKGDSIFLSAKVKNKGKSTAENFFLEFYIYNENIPRKLLGKSGLLNLSAEDSLLIKSGFSFILSSEISAVVKIIFPNDEDTLNNYAEIIIQPGYEQYACLINEIMYDPPEGESEWIELVNISGDTLNAAQWSVSDLVTPPERKLISSKDIYLYPGNFLVLAKDTSRLNSSISVPVVQVNFGTLGNQEDGIVICDFRGRMIDSVKYSSSWGGGDGCSLERISLTPGITDSSGWTTSLAMDGNSAGKSNSILNISGYKFNTLAINEIMFDPDTDNSEFIEFINLSLDTINTGGWRIEDEKGNSVKLAGSSFFIPPGDYFLIASDSISFIKYNLNDFPFKRCPGELNLSNSGELILLKDIKGNTIDSVYYSDDWHNSNFTDTKNRSLERINPRLGANDRFNWSTSADQSGATPGRENSIFTEKINSESGISVSPNPFSPDNDGFEDFTIINYNLSEPAVQIRIKIFDSRGRLVKTLVSNQASGSSGSVIFNGLDEGGEPLRIGIYILFLEALNDHTGTVEILRTLLVAARKL